MRIRTIAFIAVPVVVIPAIVIQKWLEARGPGKVVLLAPPDHAATMTFDGAEHLLPPGGFLRLEAKPGEHQLAVDHGAARTIKVEDGLSQVGVPARSPACFDELDVTLSHYGTSAGKKPPDVVRRFRFENQFELAKDMPLAEAELPRETHDTVSTRTGKYTHVQLVQMLVAVPCRDGVDYSKHM